jgi:hypothetical protein
MVVKLPDNTAFVADIVAAAESPIKLAVLSTELVVNTNAVVEELLTHGIKESRVRLEPTEV